jgi:hypothetical protein
MSPYTHEQLRKETTGNVIAEITAVMGNWNRNGTITFQAYPALMIEDGPMLSINAKYATKETTTSVIEEDNEVAYFKNIYGQNTVVNID